MGQTQNIEQQIQLLSNLQLGFGIACIAVPCTGDIPFLLSAYPAGV